MDYIQEYPEDLPEEEWEGFKEKQQREQKKAQNKRITALFLIPLGIVNLALTLFVILKILRILVEIAYIF